MARTIAETRMDVRDEADLIWRWNFADGQASGLHSSWPQDVVIAVNGGRGAMIPTTSSGGVTEDVGPRCGPIYVPFGGHGQHTFECNLDGMPAYHRMLRIDSVLRETDVGAVKVLHAALGDSPDEELRALCPSQVYGPRLCNLVEHTPAAAREHLHSRSSKSLRGWLARLAAKAATGHGDRRVLHALTIAADGLLLWAAAQYAIARRMDR